MHKNHSSMSSFFSNHSLKQNKDLQGIYDFYLKPFIKYVGNRSDFENLGDIVDIFFHAFDRKIMTFRAADKFRLSGMKALSGSKYVAGMPTIVNAGERLYIRIDRKLPDEVDVEIPRPETTLYRLTNKELQSILRHIIVEGE